MNPSLVLQNLTSGDSSFDKWYNRPLTTQVAATNPENDTMQVGSLEGAGSPTIGIPHPFMSPNSWIRAYPETGSFALMHIKAESPDWVPLGYIRDTASVSRRDATKAIIPFDRYRKMYEGEIQISSKGNADLYLSQRGDLESRSGLITQTLSMDKYEIKSRAPTHIREIPGKVASPLPGLGDEERFGLIKRSIKGDENFQTWFPIYSAYVAPPAIALAKEYVRIIKTRFGPATPSLAPVIDIREGTIVLDDQGIPVPVGAANVIGPLRMDAKYHTNPLESFRVSVNQLGNVGVGWPATTVGFGFNMQMPTASVNINVGVSWTQAVGGIINMSSIGASSWKSGGILDLTAGGVATLKGSQTLLGLAPTQSVARGPAIPPPVTVPPVPPLLGDPVGYSDLITANLFLDALAAALAPKITSPGTPYVGPVPFAIGYIIGGAQTVKAGP